MNIEEFSYEFNSSGAENLISKLRQIEYETQQLDDAASHLTSTFGKLFDSFLRSSVPPAFIKMMADQAMAFSKQAAYLDKISQTSGISAKNIQQLGYALYKFGGDTDVATRSLVSLKAKIDQLKELRKKGGEGLSELFTIKRKFGLALAGAEDPMTLLKQIAATMDKLSKDKQLKFAKALGLDDATFLMVKKGIKSVEEELYKAQKYVLFDEKDIQTSVKFEDTIKEIGADVELISKAFSFGALPTLQKFTDKIKTVTNYLSEHPELIKGMGLVAFSTGAMGVLRLLETVPTKFLAGAGAVTAFATAVGMANEEIARLDNDKTKEGTLLGTLDEVGLKGTSKGVEQVFRSLKKFGEYDYIGGLKELDGILENIINADTEGTDPLADFASGVLETKEEISNYVDEIRGYLKDSGIEDTVKGWATKGLNFAKSSWSAIEKEAPELLDQALDGAESALDWIGDTWEESGISEKISSTFNGIQQYSSGLWDQLQTSYKALEKNDFSSESLEKEISNIYTKLKTDVVGVYESIKTNAPKYIEETKKKIIAYYNEMKTSALEIYNDVSAKAAPYIQMIKNNAIKLYDNVKKNVVDTYNHIKTNAPTYISEAKKKAVEIYDKLKTNVVSIYNKISTEASPYIETIKTEALSIYDKIKKNVVETYNHITTNAPTYIEETKKNALDIYNSIKKTVIDTYNSITADSPNYIEETKQEATNLYDVIKTDVKGLYDHVIANAPSYLDSAKSFIVSTYKTIVDNIKAIYKKYTEPEEDPNANNPNFNEEIAQVKKKSINSIGDLFQYVIDLIVDEFKKIPAWAQNAITTGLKTFVFTWLATGGDTKKAGVASALLATRSALNTMIEEGDENAPVYKEVLKDLVKGGITGYLTSFGDKNAMNTAALTAAIDSIVQNVDKLKRGKDDVLLNGLVDFLKNNQNLVESTTTGFALSSILGGLGVSESKSNTLGTLAGLTEYGLGNNEKDVPHSLWGLLKTLWSNKEEEQAKQEESWWSKFTSFFGTQEKATNNLNNSIMKLDGTVQAFRDSLGLTPVNPYGNMIPLGMPNVTNDNISNSNYIVNNNMTMNGLDPQSTGKAVGLNTELTIQRLRAQNNMRNSTDFMTTGVK